MSDLTFLMLGLMKTADLFPDSSSSSILPLSIQQPTVLELYPGAPYSEAPPPQADPQRLLFRISRRPGWS
jgi:hypothetical protein